MSGESQAEAAIRLYSPRSAQYDSSWHPDFTKRFIGHLDIQPGQHVLDLACGTGLLTYLEADAVGPAGRVVGVDITPGMLAEARSKQDEERERYAHVEFYERDILNLDALDAVKEASFDVVTVASALVLFTDPKVAIEHWARFLKPGGVIAMDSTHPRNSLPGALMERVGRKMGSLVPYHREWSKSTESLGQALEDAGLEVQKVVTIDDQAGYRRRYYNARDVDKVFDDNIVKGVAASLFADDARSERARAIFKEEWDQLVVDGKVEEVDAVFLGIARKPIIMADDDVVFSGGCRCGKLRYQSGAAPSDIIVCHCRACRQLSGSAYLPFTDVSTDAFKWLATSTKEVLKLSEVAERTFCRECGTPVTMVYYKTSKSTSITMGSIYEETYKGEWPKIKMHIYVKEKAPWVELPDDGPEQRQEFKY
ncbi:S-adenosyl-L-methionine-dependent methyltransferase [Aaosphaeria arxii CBS 175.79]|uniref:S-adenosyl-L-methionine-dependent methyltransferase n=1 Tax=Aaosphaeria arxii CBS 175.79 TaxID=1450172 RepID=A0A6A5XHM5_9PLEO|nr:S-adenosyl-L-methionine-dependent methyltransferase [Aaosphaeria arxii CBS 175.79]KAF2012738.1 S-adenosyl-L-methionine-dependent methyltransferase [Aaosphaeria arxii CBS 175.79]